MDDIACGWMNVNIPTWPLAMPSRGQYWLIRKVREAWDRNHRQISTPTSPFSMKQIPILKENELVLWLFWPKTHV